MKFCRLQINFLADSPNFSCLNSSLPSHCCICSDTAIANGEASAASAHNSIVRSEHDTSHTMTTTDYFDMVPSTGVSNSSICCPLTMFHPYQPTEYYDERNAQDETVANFSMVSEPSDYKMSCTHTHTHTHNTHTHTHTYYTY